MPVLSFEKIMDMVPALNTKVGHKLTRFLMKTLAINDVNDLNDRYSRLSPPDFSESIIKDIGADYQIGNAGNLDILPEGAFITISNHPYGSIDGLILEDLIGHLRPDFKILVNEILSLIKSLNRSFITVTPKIKNSENSENKNFTGIRQSIKHLREGHPLGIFPSGAVSDLNFKNKCIEDRNWQESIIKLIKKAKLPILPIRFFDKNTYLFYILGLINWKIRVLRLPGEVTNKSGKLTRVGIGKIVSVDEQAQYTDIKSFGNFLRNKVYAMPMPSNFVARNSLNF